MSDCDDLLSKARNNPQGVRFSDICALATCFGWVFDRASGSHHIYKKAGHRIAMNFQDVRGMAKPYQVRQLLRAIDSLENYQSKK
ncbi:MAG: type II toxin-antitoxin system HicA family toxin [Gemmatimonadaceae bacterium]|nr:type II toxin-antitoxin system HicA family toxin [Gemmatimonadaceae bacterium]